MEQTVTDAPGGAQGMADDLRSGFGSLGSIIKLLVLTWGAALAAAPLNDNSFFTHLATGRIILSEGSVPSSDPYTYTHSGDAWTVQSWLASVAYAAAERAAGTLGLRALVLAAFVASALVLWRLTAPAKSLLVRVGILATALFVATGLWTERPYMIGVIGIGLVWLALEDQIPWWTMLPLMRVWGNSHGSFVLAAALVALIVAGGALDRGHLEWRLIPRHEGRAAAAVLAGVLLVAVGPLGVRALTFPLVALERSDVFAEVTEWQAPRFRSASELAYLVLVVGTMASLSRWGRTWRLTLPAAVFVAASLYAQRNIVVAAVVLVAVSARTLPAVGALRSGDRPRFGGILAGVLAGLLLLVVASTALTPAASVDDYAVGPMAWLDSGDPDRRVVTDVLNGNLLEVLDGPRGTVFIDDRFDLLTSAFLEDYLELERGGRRWASVLERHDADVVVWPRSAPLASLLAEGAGWRIAFGDGAWIVAERRPTQTER